MNKKNSLFLTCAIALFFMACSTTKTQTAQRPKKDIYLQLYSLRDDFKKDFTSTMKLVSNMGFKGVEAAGYDNGKFYGLTPAAFKAVLDQNHLESLSSHAGRQLAENIAATDWNEIWQWWDNAIAAHKAAGMKYIVIPWMPTPKTLADLKKYCDYFNQVGERCKKAGIRFGYHNHNFEFKDIDGQTMYDYMLQNTDPDKVLFEMDVYWVVKGGKNPVDYFNKYPGRFSLLHIKDETELQDNGIVDLKSIFENAKKAGLKYVVLEQERYSFEPAVSTQKSLDYLLNSSFVKPRYDK